MAMITKCPGCGTQFRIATEQLIARQGKVRCGECREIFSALKSLVHQHDRAFAALAGPGFDTRDLPTQTAPQVTLTPVTAFSIEPEASTEPLTEPLAPRPAPLAVEPSIPLPDGDETWAKARLTADRVPLRPSAIEPLAAAAEKLAQEALQKSNATEASPAAAAPVIEASPVATPPIAAEAAAVAPLDTAVPGPVAEAITEKALQSSGHPGEEPIPEPLLKASPEEIAVSTETVPPLAATPEFIAKAKAAQSRAGAHWRWRCGVLLAALLLGVQAAHAYRERIVAEWPQAKPWITELCALTHDFLPCKAPGPKRDAAQISIEFHELSSDSKAVLVLTALLRNKADFTQALPSIEVTLVDQSRQVIARRTLSPLEYLDPAQGKPTELAPNAEAQARLLIKGEGVSAATYNLQVLY